MAAHSNHKVTLVTNSRPRSHPRYAMPHEADEYAPLRASGHLPGRSPVFPLCHLPLHQCPKLSVRLKTRWEVIRFTPPPSVRFHRPRRCFSHEGLWGNTGPRVWSGSRWGSRNPEVVGKPPSYPSSVPGTFKVHHPTNPTANHALISIRALVTSYVGGKGLSGGFSRVVVARRCELLEELGDSSGAVLSVDRREQLDQMHRRRLESERSR
jgi:hypothetical protein